MDKKLQNEASANDKKPEDLSLEKIESGQWKGSPLTPRCPDNYCFEDGM